MYRGFNLTTEDDFEKYKQEGELMYLYYQNRVQTAIAKYISPDGSLDGTKMSKDWFPEINDADIFISHSHLDESKAMGLAGWLYKNFGLNSFIDSCLWGDSNKLLREIDNRFCKRSEGDRTFYDYQMRNKSTAFVHMMLSAALSKMIDKTECLIFLNTPNSISISQAITETTQSPWLYAEIETARIIQRRYPREKNESLARDLIEKAILMSESLETRFNTDLSHFYKIDQSDLDAWEIGYSMDKHFGKERSHALDILYKQNLEV